MPKNASDKIDTPKTKRGFLGTLRHIFTEGDEPSSFRELLYPLRCAHADRLMMLLICLLLAIGSVMVFSASYAYAEQRYSDSLFFVKKQLAFAFLGVVMMLVVSRFRASFFKLLARPLYALTILLLLAVLVIGSDENGAQRWIYLGPIGFQPTEVAKTALVLIFAHFFSRHQTLVMDYEDCSKPYFRRNYIWYGFIRPCILLACFCGLIALQKHLSGLIIVGCIGIIMMVLSGSRPRIIGILAAVAVPALVVFAWVVPYTRRRLDIWFNPALYPLDGGWQTLQGLKAIGSGGLFGLGLGNSRLKYSYVSEPANDFIFTITCEELGLLGALAILVLFGLFIWRGFVIALRAEDTFSRLLAFGITVKVAIQVIFNVLVVTNLFPNTGISLPFFSYGGTSLIMLMVEMGILLSVSRSADLSSR